MRTSWYRPSMRPQPRGCGNVEGAGAGGRDRNPFNEAAAARLRKYAVDAGSGPERAPSMRPQPRGCGNDATQTTFHNGFWPPSMRPQPRGCGNDRADGAGGAAGAAFNEAAA